MDDWRQHDAWWKARNMELLERGKDSSLSEHQRLLALLAHGQEEEARLAWKLPYLEAEEREQLAKTEASNG